MFITILDLDKEKFQILAKILALHSFEWSKFSFEISDDDLPFLVYGV